MIPQPPSGQGPIDPRGAFQPPPPPPGSSGYPTPPPGMMPPMPPMGPMGSMMPPPMFMAPPPPPPRKRGGGVLRTLFMVFLILGLGISVIINVALLAHSGFSSAAGGAMQTSIVDGDSDQKIAHVPIKGIIMEDAYER